MVKPPFSWPFQEASHNPIYLWERSNDHHGPINHWNYLLGAHPPSEQWKNPGCLGYLNITVHPTHLHGDYFINHISIPIKQPVGRFFRYSWLAGCFAKIAGWYCFSASNLSGGRRGKKPWGSEGDRYVFFLRYTPLKINGWNTIMEVWFRLFSF